MPPVPTRVGGDGETAFAILMVVISVILFVVIYGSERSD